MSYDLDSDDIESGKFHCPKCSFDVIFDEENSFYDVGRKPNDGFRILFLNWIYDYSSYDFHEKMKILGQAGGYLTYWLIRTIERDEINMINLLKSVRVGIKNF